MKDENYMHSATLEILVEDIEKTINWYRDYLGFELLFQSPESGTPTFARIKQDKCELMLFRRTEFSQEIKDFTSVPMGGSFVLYVETDNIQHLWDKINGQVQVVQSIHQTGYGSTEFTIRDVNGYHLMFGERE